MTGDEHAGAVATPPRRRRALLAGVGVALLLVLGAVAVMTLTDGGPAVVALDADGCVTDPEGDVVSPEPAPDVEDMRRADLVSLCVVQDEGGVTFSAALDGPAFDLSTPSSFSDGTWVSWGVDADADGTDDHVVVAGVDELGDPTASVVDPASNAVVCDGLELSTEGTDIEVRDVPARCLGDPPLLRVVVVRSLDTDGGPGVAAAADRLPDRGSAIRAEGAPAG